MACHRRGLGSPENPIPMAKGGVVTVNRPTTFLAGEAGPERVAVSAPAVRLASREEPRSSARWPATVIEADADVSGRCRAGDAAGGRAAMRTAPNPLPPASAGPAGAVESRDRSCARVQGAMQPPMVGIAAVRRWWPERMGRWAHDGGGPWGR